jgi:hypothetical protein
MPSVTPRQNRAMFAAAEGKGRIGIPESVGREYAEADMRRAHGGKLTKADRGKMESLRGRARTSSERGHR